jgi:hypothetical protein
MPETLKQLQELVGNILGHTGIGNDFLSRTQKRKNKQMGLHQTKELLYSKRNSH